MDVIARLGLFLGFLMVLIGSGCSRSGGSGGGMPLAESEFLIADVSYGRQVEQPDGTRTVISPLTTVETDPVTGQANPETVLPLASEVDVEETISLELERNFVPPLVPRNATLVVRLSREVDESSVVGDVVDSEGNIVTDGSVQVRTRTGKAVAADVSVHQGIEIWIDPVTETSPGFPASPLTFSANGTPMADAEGSMTLFLDPSKILALDGTPLGAREDQLGTDAAFPIAFNPGNRELDFAAQLGMVSSTRGSNGFLPDVTPPGILRDLVVTGRLEAALGDTSDAVSVTIAGASFATMARNGAGEWSGATFVARPGQVDAESVRIERNTSDTLWFETSLEAPLQEGERYRFRRAELFEPDPASPIFPNRFDPHNPENDNNTDFSNFVTAYNIDDDGNRTGPPLPLESDEITKFSELAVKFTEPMDRNSLGQWENFMVTADPDDGTEWVTRLVLSDNQREVRIQPVLVDQIRDRFEVVGWAPALEFPLQLILQTIPDIDFLLDQLSGSDVQDFLDLGFRSITDLGGTPLGFPVSAFDPESPRVQYKAGFVPRLMLPRDVGDLGPPRTARNWKMLVHRFRGSPRVGVDPDTREPGIVFRDKRNVYSPAAEVHTQQNGRLAGPPVVYATRILDQFFPPPGGQFGAFPQGATTPLVAGDSDQPLPPETLPWVRSHYGARFQQVYRDVDASLGNSLQGTLLDLYRLSFAPIGRNVTSDVYEDISIHVAHSPIRPITEHNGASAVEPNFGLHEAFDWESYVADALSQADDSYSPACRQRSAVLAPNVYEGSLITCVFPGTRWEIQPKNLYTPPGTDYVYHPFPEFDRPFHFNNGAYPREHKKMRADFNDMIRDLGGPSSYWREKRGATDGDSLLVEYRIRPQVTGISRNNGFTFSPAILLTAKPNFRVWSIGTNNSDVAFSPDILGPELHPDRTEEDIRARCSNGYAADYTSNPPRGGPDDYRRIDYRRANGDNSRYFTAFDYVKATTVITSPYVRTADDPIYASVYFEPHPEEQPPGTRVEFEFRGAEDRQGSGDSNFSGAPSDHSGRTHLSFRVTLRSDRETRLAPTLETVAIPYLDE